MSGVATVGTTIARLGDVATFVRGITFKPDDVVPLGSPDSVACMRTKNVQTAIDLSDVWAVPKSLVKRTDQYLKAGDMLVSSANSWNLVGKCCLVPELPWPTTLGGFISALRGATNRVDARYLFHWFSSPRIQATVRSFGQQTTNISNLNVERCLNLPMPLPTLPEQRRIAEILDKADALRAKRRAALAQLDTLTQAIFLDMFGDPASNPQKFPWKPLAALIRLDDTINYGVVHSGDDIASGISLIRVGDLIEGRVHQTSLKRIEPSIEARYKRSRLRGDEILLSCVGSIGLVALADESVRGFNIARAVARIPLAGIVDRRFIAVYLASSFVQRYFTAELRTVSQPTLNIKQISETPVMVPPVEAQQEFAKKAEAVEALKSRHRNALSDFDALFASLQHRAFRGEL